MHEPKWKVERTPAGEMHTTSYRGLQLNVTRPRGHANVVGSVFTGSGERIERFSARCTVEQAEARCVRVADRHAEDQTV